MTDAATDIFDHRRYLEDALLLTDGENEDDVDARLTAAARECGIDDPDLFLVFDLPTAIQNMSLTSLPVHSPGIHDAHDAHDARSASPARASFSVDRSPAAPMRHRHSSSQFTFMSLPNPPIVRPHSTRKSKRASAIFSIFRKEQSAFPSRSHHHYHHPHHFKHQSPKLECGHSLSKYAIRAHVQEALEKKDGAAPMCCGRPLPRHVLAMVLTNAEVDLVAETTIPSPDESSCRDSGYSENGLSSVDLPNVLDAQVLVSEPSTVPATPTDEPGEVEVARLNSALQNEAFQKLLGGQRDEFRRISVFEANQRQTLLANYQHSLEQLAVRLKTTQFEREQQHMQQMERLDEFQLRVEHDLRESHRAETQNVATALKYMEAYCTGPNPAHPEISYAVTDEDRRKLERQRILQGKLPAKHDSVINVLRAKQERDAKAKLQRQQSELEQLRQDYTDDTRAQQIQYESDTRRLDAIIHTRRSRVIRRWNLKMEIWRRNWEKEYGMTLHGRIPHGDWP